MYPTPNSLWQTFKPDNDYPPIFSLEYPLKILRFWWSFGYKNITYDVSFIQEILLFVDFKVNESRYKQCGVTPHRNIFKVCSAFSQNHSSKG